MWVSLSFWLDYSDRPINLEEGFSCYNFGGVSIKSLGYLFCTFISLGSVGLRIVANPNLN